MHVKYRGYKYKVRFWHGLLYHLLSISLCIKRTVRRLEKVIQFLSPVLFLIPVWGLFIFLLSMIEKQNILSYVDECKYSIFTSVVISAIVRLQGKVPEYRKNLQKQHEMYVTLMRNTDCLIEYLFEHVVSKDEQPIDIPSWPTYTYERYRKIKEILPSCSIEDSYSQSELNSMLTLINEDISELKVLNSKDGLQVADEIDYDLDCAYQRVREFQTKATEKSVDVSILEHIIGDLFFLVDGVRYPWRRDVFVNQTRRMIIAENNPDPDDRDHYFNLFEVI